MKAMDVAPQGRVTSPVWRELLGWRLATRLGLAVPVTWLARDAHYGRISLQQYVPKARPVAYEERCRIAATRRGLRILALDFVARNRDRHRDNLLTSGDVVFPIDYNVAFDYSADTIRWQEVKRGFDSWFGVAGMMFLARSTWEQIASEVRRTEKLFSEQFIRHAATAIDCNFLDDSARVEVSAGMMKRCAVFGANLRRWWDETIVPLRNILNGVT